ncbi:RNA polymerase II transcription factor B subunit 1 [Umbelopsis sp. WA50703]
MWEPDEQLVLRSNTKYKKKEGTLFATSRRVAWQQSGSRQLHPAVRYGDIQVQMQSPATDKNIRLKIVTNPPESKSYVFHFESARAIAEREAIKAYISESMVRARQQAGDKSATPAPVATTTDSPSSSVASTPAPSTPIIQTPSNAPTPAPAGQNVNFSRQEEIASRLQLLSKSKELHTLHSELVINSKNVTEEEFWDSPYVQKIRQQMKKDAASKEGQQKGKSSKMVELRPGQQEGSDVKYTLTSQIIHDIFAQYPSVKRAYDANVPDKMSEQNFWKRFLASEFFHRSRTGNRSTNAAADDVFDKCLREEDAENLNAPSLAEFDHFKKTIDLSATAEDHNEVIAFIGAEKIRAI